MVGGGFGGLACVRALRRDAAQVTLVDQRNYHLFTPLLYQVATALLNPSDIAIPFRPLFRRWRNTRFRQDKVEGVDFAARRLDLSSGESLDYDYLVLATGSTDNHYGNEAVAEHTISMKTLSEALQLRNRALVCLEYAERSSDEAERRRWLTFVVVGGGPTGVEYAGALSELLHMTLGRDYPDLSFHMARVVLVEGNENLLRAFPVELSEYTRRMIEKRGVEVRTGSRVHHIEHDHVVLDDGTIIDSRTVVWSAGVRPNDPIPDTDLERSASNRLEVDERFRLKDQDRVFVVGDLASVPGPGGGELPMVSPPAMQGGRYVAARIRDHLRGGDAAVDAAQEFRYRDKGMMATIGRNHAVGVIRGVRFRGFIGWIAWLVVHLYYVVGFRNRLLVLSHWAWEYLRRDRPIRIVASSHADNVVGDLDE